MVVSKTNSKKTSTKKPNYKPLSGDGLLVLPNFSRYFLLLVVAGSVFLLLWVISPFFTVLIYAALIAIFFNPVNKWFVKVFRGHKGISAFLTTLFVILVVLGPLTLFVVFIAQEAFVTYQVLDAKLMQLDFKSVDFNQLNTIPVIGEPLDKFFENMRFKEIFGQLQFDIYAIVQDIGQNVSSFIVNSSASLVKSIGNTVVNIFILILTVFFFFKDGDRIRNYLKILSPLPLRHEEEIEKKLKETTYGIAIGAFGTAILQGIMGGIGFAIAGIDHAIFYATIMSFAALIPYIGSSIIWAPAALAVLLSGEVGWGIFLIVWGFTVISNIDNFVRPYLIGSSSSMHPLTTFLAVLGGLFVFGLKGLVFGPIILSLVLTIFHIYKLEYSEVLST
ncbi:AI-2E family transporter [Patescibacteria group bacterium]|nr:AI-2E family transporter [Patescibacteria group bacterium]